MKVVMYENYGTPDVLHFVDVPKPVPKDNEILVRVRAVAVTAADSRIRQAKFPKGFSVFARLIFGIRGPRHKVLGGSFSGEVAAIGKGVRDFQPGDEVCGTTGIRLGCYAEYIVVPASKTVVRKPAGVRHEDAAGVLFGGTTALYYLRDKLKVRSGEAVLINGASGAVGTTAVQLARYFGATVTGICSGANARLVQDLGAEHVIDYTITKPSQIEDKYDVVLDTVGSITIPLAKKLLRISGRAGLLVASLGETLGARGPIIAGPAPERRDDIAMLLRLLEEQKLRVVIDHVYDFEDIVAAHERVDTGHKVGNVIVRIA